MQVSSSSGARVLRLLLFRRCTSLYGTVWRLSAISAGVRLAHASVHLLTLRGTRATRLEAENGGGKVRRPEAVHTLPRTEHTPAQSSTWHRRRSNELSFSTPIFQTRLKFSFYVHTARCARLAYSLAPARHHTLTLSYVTYQPNSRLWCPTRLELLVSGTFYPNCV